MEDPDLSLLSKSSELDNSLSPPIPFPGIGRQSISEMENIAIQLQENVPGGLRSKLSLKNGSSSEKNPNFTIVLPPRSPINEEDVRRRHEMLKFVDMETDVGHLALGDDVGMSSNNISRQDAPMVSIVGDVTTTSSDAARGDHRLQPEFRMPDSSLYHNRDSKNQEVPPRRSVSMALPGYDVGPILRKASLPMSPTDLPSPVSKRLSDPILFFKSLAERRLSMGSSGYQHGSLTVPSSLRSSILDTDSDETNEL